MGKILETQAVILESPGSIGIESVGITAPTAKDIVVETRYSGISTGTEKLFWSGDMPPFPGMGYPLVPGYETSGEVVEAGVESGFKVGDHVFVPGSDCFVGAKGLFGGSARRIVTAGVRATRIDSGLGAAGALLALAATARHAMAGPGKTVPDLIVGHGVLGRLLARLTIAAGAPAPTVWEIDPSRMSGAEGYAVLHPDADERRDYASIYDASGQSSLLDQLITRTARGGEIVLAGFYAQPLSFAFAPAFMKETRMRVSAEWQPDDMTATRALVESGTLRMDDLITHQSRPANAQKAYRTAFSDPSCLKMILDWSAS